jgi:hypothetical protein
LKVSYNIYSIENIVSNKTQSGQYTLSAKKDQPQRSEDTLYAMELTDVIPSILEVDLVMAPQV